MKRSICSAIVLICVIMSHGAIFASGQQSGSPEGYRPQLPQAAFGKQQTMQTLPEPRMQRAISTINLHLTGIDGDTDYGMPILYIGNPFTGNGQPVEPVKNAPRLLQFSFEQYATRMASLNINDRNIYILVP